MLGQYPALMGGGIMPRVPDLALRRVVQSEGLPVEIRGQAAVALAGQTGLQVDGSAAWALVSATTMAGDLPDAVRVARGVQGVSASVVPDYVEAALRLGLVEQAAAAMPQWPAVSGTAAAKDIRRGVQAKLALQVLQGRVADDIWDEWIVAQVLENGEGVKQAQRTLLVAEALGVGVPQRIWSQLRVRSVPVSMVVDPAWQRLLADAVVNRNLPQVLGLVTEAWSGQNAADGVPVVVGAGVEALRKSGLTEQARRMAAEALLGMPSKPLSLIHI